MTIARILLCRPGAEAAFPAVPPALGAATPDGPTGAWRRATLAPPGARAVSVVTLVPVCTLTLTGQPACVVEAYVDGDATAFTAWVTATPAILFAGTVLEFRAIFAALNARGAQLRAAWPGANRRFAPGDTRPSSASPGGASNAGGPKTGAPRATARLGLAPADDDDAAPDAAADAPQATARGA